VHFFLLLPLVWPAIALKLLEMPHDGRTNLVQYIALCSISHLAFHQVSQNLAGRSLRILQNLIQSHPPRQWVRRTSWWRRMLAIITIFTALTIMAGTTRASVTPAGKITSTGAVTRRVICSKRKRTKRNRIISSSKTLSLQLLMFVFLPMKIGSCNS
jgi:hypothetical protein